MTTRPPAPTRGVTTPIRPRPCRCRVRLGIRGGARTHTHTKRFWILPAAARRHTHTRMIRFFGIHILDIIAATTTTTTIFCCLLRAASCQAFIHTGRQLMVEGVHGAICCMRGWGFYGFFFPLCRSARRGGGREMMARTFVFSFSFPHAQAWQRSGYAFCLR
jgi:hypothetical protein